VVEGTAEQMGFLGNNAKLIPGGFEMVCPGWTWAADVFTAPVVVKYVPPEVTMRQARIALHNASLLTSISTAINALSDPAKTLAGIEWEYSNSLVRSNSFVATLGAALGLTNDQIDDLFIAASQVR
jgi:hypothetical protein